MDLYDLTGCISIPEYFEQNVMPFTTLPTLRSYSDWIDFITSKEWEEPRTPMRKGKRRRRTDRSSFIGLLIELNDISDYLRSLGIGSYCAEMHRAKLSTPAEKKPPVTYGLLAVSTSIQHKEEGDPPGTLFWRIAYRLFSLVLPTPEFPNFNDGSKAAPGGSYQASYRNQEF